MKMVANGGMFQKKIAVHGTHEIVGVAFIGSTGSQFLLLVFLIILYRHGVKQKQYPLLCVSQFTLYGTLSKRNQPDYKLAMKAVPAEALYNKFLDMLRREYNDDKVFDGVFGAMMDVSLVNDGPVTIMIESEPEAS